MFHVKNGLTFERKPDASVVVDLEGRAIEMTPEEWASVVSSMSAEGETAETFYAALERQRPA